MAGAGRGGQFTRPRAIGPTVGTEETARAKQGASISG